MGLVLGLDGGGTKTLLALANRDGDVVRLERTLGLDPAQGPIWKPRLRDLLRASGALEAELEGSAFGLPSHGEIETRDVDQRAAVADLVGPGAVVENDVRIAFDGVFANGGGILLLAGTGSMAWASSGGAANRHVRVGGWGEAFGDEGSAFWIGRESLALAARALDGRHAGVGYAEALLGRMGLKPGKLCAWVAGLEDRRSGIASVARIVSDLAELGHSQARETLEDAAGHLADHYAAARTAIDDHRTLGWSHAGGVFSSRVVRVALEERIGSPPLGPRLPPVGGALLRAADAAGWPTGDAFVERLARSLARRLRH